MMPGQYLWMFAVTCQAEYYVRYLWNVRLLLIVGASVWRLETAVATSLSDVPKCIIYTTTGANDLIYSGCMRRQLFILVVYIGSTCIYVELHPLDRNL
jgi:hypothetical protein